MQVDQSAVTGESLALGKRRGDLVYQSSTIKRGDSFTAVTALGDSTYFGRSASLVNAASTGKGHLINVMDRIARNLLGLVILTILVAWISSFYRSKPIMKILNDTLAITIIGVSVGLPVVITTIMAVGAAYMAKRKAVVPNYRLLNHWLGWRSSALTNESLCTVMTDELPGTLTLLTGCPCRIWKMLVARREADESF